MSLENDRLLDNVGWQILRALQEDARLSYSELGRRVGLSVPAVAERVRKMEDAGIITGYRAEINLEKVGYPISAFIRVSASGENCSRIGQIARGFPEVLECHRVTGSDSCVMKVVVSSVSHLEELIDRLVPYGNPTTSVVLSTPVRGRVVEGRVITDERRTTNDE